MPTLFNKFKHRYKECGPKSDAGAVRSGSTLFVEKTDVKIRRFFVVIGALRVNIMTFSDPYVQLSKISERTIVFFP